MPDEFDQFSGGFGSDSFGPNQGPPDQPEDDLFGSFAEEETFFDRVLVNDRHRFLSVGLGFYEKLNSLKTAKKA